jgi:hypothetical protein
MAPMYFPEFMHHTIGSDIFTNDHFDLTNCSPKNTRILIINAYMEAVNYYVRRILSLSSRNIPVSLQNILRNRSQIS